MLTYGIPKEIDLSGSRVLITGASGWLGLETLCILNSWHPGFKGLSLTLAGSQRRSLDLHGQQLNLVPIGDISTSESFDLILHFAFATQDKLSSLGLSRYVAVNTELNNWISNLGINNPRSRKLILSSGAVSRYLGPKYEGTSMGIYAQLKLQLESNFSNPESILLRLWNTSGHHMSNDPKYALSEFISRARSNQAILVNRNLRRSYVAASSILSSSISYLLQGGSGIVNSGGESTKLYELANLVVQVLKSDSVVSLVNSEQEPELDYVSPKTEIPSRFWTNYLDLPTQIQNTASYFA